MSWGRFVSALVTMIAVVGCAVVALGMSQQRRATVSPQHGDRAAAFVEAASRPVRMAAAARVQFAPAARPAATAWWTASPSMSAASSAASTAPASGTSLAGGSPGAAAPAPGVPTTLHASARPLVTHAAVRRAPRTFVRHARHATSAATAGASRKAPSRIRHVTPTTATSSATSPVPARSRTATAATHSRTRTVARLGGRLPLPFRTHHARQVITVVARHASSTTAVLQAWRKTRSGGWLRRGPRITAWIGAQGMTTHPSESKSATPIGSFTLTHAFGHDRNPGTSLPYLHTNPSDWWISQAGPLYNTHQRCSSHCAFRRGAPNEHLYYETPYYNYAAVIDYNTRNAPGGVRQGAGSAFFLHVTVHQPTAGCVAIPQARLISILRWLRPTAHPRILIGVA